MGGFSFLSSAPFPCCPSFAVVSLFGHFSTLISPYWLVSLWVVWLPLAVALDFPLAVGAFFVIRFEYAEEKNRRT